LRRGNAVAVLDITPCVGAFTAFAEVEVVTWTAALVS
jgi:hypothetical protein